MKFIYLFIILGIYGCSKPKSVFICGDHVCINKAEAQQYFEDNLSLEVKIIKKKNKTADLVQLNLRSDSTGRKKINLLNKTSQNTDLKVLSKSEIKKTKAKIKARNKIDKKKTEIKKQAKKVYKKVLPDINKTQPVIGKTEVVQNNAPKILIKNEIGDKPLKDVVDICSIIQECSIDEISKYLIKKSEGKKFPDITLKE